MLAALILAGGKGARLGGLDKAFLPLAGKPLIAHVLDRLAPLLPPPGHIAISANGDATRFAAFSLPVLPDGAYAGTGPLAGILAGLTWAHAIGAASLLTIPVDTPFFPADFLSRLTPAPAVATHRGRQHHLAAHWPASAGATIRAFLATPGPHRVRDALALVGARPVTFDAANDPFLNINTAADLAVAQKLVAV